MRFEHCRRLVLSLKRKRTTTNNNEQHVVWRLAFSKSTSEGEAHVPGIRKHGYIDEWFASIVKPQSFYDSHANSDTRCYFYNVDLQGRLFLEETLPKNIATSIKNAKFLDFFFRRLQRARPQDEQLMVDRDIPVIDYPFVSPCGKELNFIRPAVTPVVFHALSRVETTRTEELVYAGTKSQPFDEQHLAISQETGRLYHRLLSKGTLYGDYGLIRSSVAVELSERIEACDEEDIGSVSGFGILTESSGVLAIPWLPQDAEPGLWSMPFSDDTVES